MAPYPRRQDYKSRFWGSHDTVVLRWLKNILVLAIGCMEYCSPHEAKARGKGKLRVALSGWNPAGSLQINRDHRD